MAQIFGSTDLAAPPRSARPVSHPTIFPNFYDEALCPIEPFSPGPCANCDHLYYLHKRMIVNPYYRSKVLVKISNTPKE